MCRAVVVVAAAVPDCKTNKSMSQKLPRAISLTKVDLKPVWPDWVINCTLGNFSKPVSPNILPKLPTF